MIRSRIFFTKNQSLGPINANFPKVDGQLDYSGSITAIIINARKLLEEIKAHFREYMQQLRDENNIQLRENFKKACLIKWPMGETIQIGNLENP